MAHTNPQETIVDAVVIPALQAVTTGVLVGTAAGAGAWALAWDNPGAVGLATGAAVAAFSWLNYRADWAERIRAILGIETTHQAEAIQAATYNQTVRVEVISDNAHAGDFLELPGGRERLTELARGLTAGKSLTTRVWAGGGGLYTGPVYSRLCEELISRGLARWKSPHSAQSGVELTAKGRATMRGIALANQPPTPNIGFHLESCEAPQDQSRAHAHTTGSY
jgi:hypothetical protein